MTRICTVLVPIFAVALIFPKADDVLALLAMGQEKKPHPAVGSMTFFPKSFRGGKVTLSNGEYREPAAPGSASEIIVKLTGKGSFGVVDGRQTGAVVLMTDTGGSGTFYDLALLRKEAKEWVNTNTIFLGDRVKVHSVEIRDGHIVVRMTTHGPNDPMCCSTREVTRRFTIKKNRLVSVAEKKTDGKLQVTGTVWQWVQTLYNDDTKNVPTKPENYTIQFLEDGKLRVRADCNLKGGVYSTDGKKISIEITQSTMAACEEGSLEKPFVCDLTGSSVFFLKDDDLFIDLKYDTGTMKFSRQMEK